MNTVNQVHYCPCCVGFNRRLTLMASSQKADKFISSRIENIKAINNNNVRIMAAQYRLSKTKSMHFMILYINLNQNTPTTQL